MYLYVRAYLRCHKIRTREIIKERYKEALQASTQFFYEYMFVDLVVYICIYVNVYIYLRCHKIRTRESIKERYQEAYDDRRATAGGWWVRRWFTYVHMYIHEHIYVHIFTPICIYEFGMPVSTCMYVCIYSCTNIYTSKHIP
jgi:hypothetical protein